MAQVDNIYDKIQELLGVIPANITILEQKVDSDIQNEYHNYAQSVSRQFNHDDILKKRNVVFEDDQTEEDRKDMIFKLSCIDHIDAYRTLERCTDTMPGGLRDWAVLALQENRLLLESRLLEQNSILISTGMGGKGLRLRYFTAFTSNNEFYSTFEKSLLINEVNYAFARIRGEAESIRFDREICSVVGLIPLPVPVQKFIDEIIAECNLYGNFINPDYIITNVRVISNHEIRNLASLRKNKARKQ